MACSLIKHKRIKTTLAKAKALRGYVERLVTYAKKGELHGRRLILKNIKGSNNKSIANILIHENENKDWIFKICDFGFTRPADNSDTDGSH